MNSLLQKKSWTRPQQHVSNRSARPASLLLRFFSILFQASFLLVSAESQSQHCRTSLVRFRCVTPCHPICFVQFRVDVCKIRQLLLHYILHKHVFQHHVLLSTWSTRVTSCPNYFKRCFVTIPSALPVVSAYLLQQNSGSPFAVFVTMRRDLRFTTAQLRHLCFCMSSVDLPNRCLCTRSRTSGV